MVSNDGGYDDLIGDYDLDDDQKEHVPSTVLGIASICTKGTMMILMMILKMIMIRKKNIEHEKEIARLQITSRASIGR